jgi:SHS family lactate transporter-like MFS transporter
MSTAADTLKSVPWWKEPTRDQWRAWWAAWLGWTLDAFDFTVFLLIMVPIAKEFDVPLTAVAAVFTITLWMRLVGAVASGWLADRVGRKLPLMISILWYSICNFIAGFSPTFTFLFFFRALLGIGMGAEWPAGAALAMESWPARSRGLMSGILQGSWGLGFLLSSLIYGLFYNVIGWRGLLWVGILPALAVVYIRYFVKEPAVWVENRRKQREDRREVRAPLISIFKRGLLGNTLTACWWMASGFVVYYSIWALFATYLQKDLNLSPALVATPIALANLAAFFAMGFWGWVADSIGRRWSIIIPALIGCLIAPIYLLTADITRISVGFIIQGLFAGAIYGQNPSYLTERFPTEVRGTASAFCYHQGAIFGGMVAPVLTYFAVNYNLGFAIPMLIGTVVGLISTVLSLLVSPETKGTVFKSDIVVA